MKIQQRVAALAMASLLLPGAAMAEDWVLSMLRIDTEQATNLEASDLGRTGLLHLDPDGSASLRMTGVPDFDGTWSEEENVVTLTAEDGQTLLIDRKDQTLEMASTGLIYVFEQAKPEPETASFITPTAISAATADEFFGTWSAKWCVSGSLTLAMSDTGEQLGFVVDEHGVTMIRGDKQFQLNASFAGGVLVLPDLEVALALDDDGSLSMVQGSITFFLYRMEENEQ